MPRDFDVIDVPFRERGVPQLTRARDRDLEVAELAETEPVPGT